MELNQVYLISYSILLINLIMTAIFSWSIFFTKGSTKWYWQRVSAFILVPTSYWFVFFFVNNLEASHSLILNSLNSFFVKFFMILFFFVATFHARLGLVTIYQDYFNEKKVKLYSRLTDILLLLVILFILPVILI